MLSMPSDVFPDGSVASVYGIASMGSGFGGMLFTLTTGWLVDHFSYVPVFFGFGLMPLVSVAIQWLFLGSLDASAGPRRT
jgi:MFS transporter, ACS family, hexuronate transporter